MLLKLDCGDVKEVSERCNLQFVFTLQEEEEKPKSVKVIHFGIV